MSTTFTIRHTFNCDADTFWSKVFKNQEFNTELYKKELKFGFEIVEDREEGDKLHRQLKITPNTDAPKAVKKVLGDGLTYLEKGVLENGRYKYKIATNKLNDKIDIGGELWVEPNGDKIDRLCRVDITVRIPLVGKTIESFVAKTTKDSYDTAAGFTNRFLAREGVAV